MDALYESKHQGRDETTYKPNNSGPQAGYYCSVCECILRDSQSYLDHINGKYHNRALGMSMRVEQSTADQVCALVGSCACPVNACEEGLRNAV